MTAYIEIDLGEYNIKTPDFIVIDYTFPATAEGLALAIESRDGWAFITGGKLQAEIHLCDPDGEAISIPAIREFFKPAEIKIGDQIAAVEARLTRAGITASEAMGAIAYWTAPDSHTKGRGIFVKARRHANGWRLEAANPTTTIDEEDGNPTIGLPPLVLKAARLRGDDLDGFAIHADWMTRTPGGDPILVNEFELPRFAELPTMAEIIDAWTPPQPSKVKTARELRALAA